MTKADAGEIVTAYKEQIVLLKEQLAGALAREEKLQAQVERLQDGVMAIRSPDAYRDMKADSREYTVSAEQVEQAKKDQQLRRIRDSYVRAIEGSTLKTGEDLDVMMESLLARGGVMKSKSLHGNTES